MGAGGEVFVNYVALEQLRTRLQGLAQSFSAIRPLPEISATSVGDSGLAHAYEGFRSEWASNRQSILQELEAAGQVLSEAVATYQTADASVAESEAG